MNTNTNTQNKTAPQAPSDKASVTSSETASIQSFFSIVIKSAGTQAPHMKRALWMSVITSVIRGLMFLLFVPLFTAVTSKDFNSTMLYLAVLTILWGFSSITDWISRGYDSNGHSGKACDELRRNIGVHLRTIPLQQLYAKRTGEVNADLAGNVDLAVNYGMMIATMIITAVVTPTVVGFGALFYDWRLGLALLLIFPAVIPVFMWIQPMMSRHREEYIEASNTISSETIEYVQGLPILKSSNCIGEKASRFNEANKVFKKLQIESSNKEAPVNVLVASIIEIGMVLVVGIGLWLLSSGDISLMLLAGIMVATIRFAEPLTAFISMMATLVLMQNVYKRLDEVVAIKPLPQTTPEQTPQQFDIAFNNVQFRYDNSDETALNNVHLTIQGNALTALVGSSGCGKTTLVRMLMRFADPQQGSICIGGVDVKQMSPATLNKVIGVVFQDVYLFDDTVFANIKMGNMNATDEQVYAAAKSAYCHDFIKRLPQGYQTTVGDIGGNLSGGEKQRISIARALLKDAPIVVLDEPTAALDTESEIAVQNAIDTLVKNKTVIVIAHRLSTIVAANQIVVMDNGGIAETGTHDELLAENGRYSRLWNAG